jgi:predicted nucleic acid-binding protein
VVVPEIADYEVRRELIRGSKTAGLRRLDALIATVEYAPLTTAAMRQAAQFWAQARQQGRPTAADQSIDGDVILAAQAITFGAVGVIVATTNVGHLSRYVATDLWHRIQ